MATVVLGAQNYDSGVSYSGLSGVFIGIKPSPTANVLDVVRQVRADLPDIERQLPSGIHQAIAFDATMFINASIKDVIKTLVEALLIVTAVIFLFLGSPRAAAVPAIAMPLSLVGAFIVMLVLGYSINLLTLLALVLAIGLVVDDAIIVVENIDRHMKEGSTPFDSAIQGARELGGPIVAMTVVLVAAYAPIAFQSGLTGALFTQFAFTLVGAITVSAIIALTLSPMMCSRIFSAEHGGGAIRQTGRSLVLALALGLSAHAHELARDLARPHRAPGAAARLASLPLRDIVFGARAAGGSGIRGVSADRAARCDLHPDADLLRPGACGREIGAGVSRCLPGHRRALGDAGTWRNSIQALEPSARRSADELQQVLQQKWNTIAGAEVAAFQFPPLPGSQGMPLQFVITTQRADRESLPGGAAGAESRQGERVLLVRRFGDLKID